MQIKREGNWNYRIGDEVLLSTRNLPGVDGSRRIVSKLGLLYYGPFTSI